MIELVTSSVDLLRNQPVALPPVRAFFGKAVNLSVPLPEEKGSPEVVIAEPGAGGGGRKGGRPHFLRVFSAKFSER